MPKRQDPAEQLLDLLVYAPLGLAMEAAELVPRLADKGRQRVGAKVTVARMVGELALRQGQRRAETLLRRLQEQQSAARRAARPSGHEPGPGPSVDTSGGASSTAGARSEPPTRSSPAPGLDRPRAGPDPRPSAAGSVSELSIHGYDTLSASQVLPRLEGLAGPELEAVRLYEEAHRARKTVLTRIDQLQDTAG